METESLLSVLPSAPQLFHLQNSHNLATDAFPYLYNGGSGVATQGVVRVLWAVPGEVHCTR